MTIGRIILIIQRTRYTTSFQFGNFILYTIHTVNTYTSPVNMMHIAHQQTIKFIRRKLLTINLRSIKPVLYTVDKVCRESVAMVVVDKGEVITLSYTFYRMCFKISYRV